MDELFQILADNIGAVMTVLGSSAVLQAAISILVAVIIKLRNNGVTKALITRLQERSDASAEARLAEERERMLEDVKNVAAECTLLAVRKIITLFDEGNSAAHVDVNAYIQTILSAEGNEQLKIDYEAIRAASVKSLKRTTDTLAKDIEALLGEIHSKPEPKAEEPVTETLAESEPEETPEPPVEEPEYDV